MRAPRLGLVLALVAGVFSAPALPRAEPLLEHYVGALHEHSGYSDGWPGSTPATYFASGKAHGLDFMGSGEHSDSADIPTVFSEQCLTPGIAACAVADPDPVKSFTKWDSTLAYALAAGDEAYTAFRGFEWTSDRFGHINVYFSRNDTNAKVDGGYATMETFWRWFRTRAELGGGADGIMTFNHPDAKKLDDGDPFKNWNDFAHVPDVDARVVGIEVFNDGRDYGSRGPAEGWYAHALDKGWHVGAIGAEDLGHDPTDDWGGPDEPKTVLIALDRSQGALREAMMARRMYALRASHGDLRIAMNVAGEEMGARLARPAGQALPIDVSVSGDPAAARVEIVTNGGALHDAADGAALSGSITVTGEERYYFVRVRDATGDVIAYSSPVWVRAELDFAVAGEWVAGDFHIHSTYSHDAWDPVADDNTGPEEFYTLGHHVTNDFAIAMSRGLDFLAITDHNDIRSQTDPGFGAFGVMGVHAYENSLGGHAQMLGARACYRPDGPVPDQVSECNFGPGQDEDDPAQVTQMADALRADGGVFQINHPADGDAAHTMGSWPDTYGYSVIPDTLEAWNISPLWQPPMPSGNSTEDALSYWEGFLDRGHRVAATGGSDNHWVSTTAVQGPGQPTTWVFVTERSERGILEGLRAGRTTISFQPPMYGGPRLFLEADADGDGVFESMAGDTVPPGAAVRVRPDGALPGSSIRIVTSVGSSEHAVGIDPVAVTVPAGATWVRAELTLPDLAAERAATCDPLAGDQTTYCRNRLLILAMTSALFVA